MAITTVDWQCPFCDERRKMHMTPAITTPEDIANEMVRYHLDDMDVRAHLLMHNDQPETLVAPDGSTEYRT